MKSLEIFNEIMAEIENQYSGYPRELETERQVEVAIQLTRLEMEHESREKHGEGQAAILGLAAQLVAAYVESFEKTNAPFPSFDEFMGIVKTAVELEKEEKPAEPMPETQG